MYVTILDFADLFHADIRIGCQIHEVTLPKAILVSGYYLQTKNAYITKQTINSLLDMIGLKSKQRCASMATFKIQRFIARGDSFLCGKETFVHCLAFISSLIKRLVVFIRRTHTFASI